MEPSSAAISREVASAVGAMAVTPSNVLQVHNALQVESERLSAKLKLHQPALRVGEAGKDPSQDRQPQRSKPRSHRWSTDACRCTTRDY